MTRDQAENLLWALHAKCSGLDRREPTREEGEAIEVILDSLPRSKDFIDRLEALVAMPQLSQRDILAAGGYKVKVIPASGSKAVEKGDESCR